MRTNEIVKRTMQTPGELFVRESAPGQAQSRKICGYAILFNTLSAVLMQDSDYEVREIIDPKAVTKELLDSCDIAMTMYHDGHILLARSVKGKGTLSYRVDSKGVYFEFDAPNTMYGNEALELVKRGDISGCSFIFDTYYYNSDYVKCTTKTVNGVEQETYRVVKMLGIYDFTLTYKPAYPSTSVEARENEQRKAKRELQERTNVAKNLRQLANYALGENPEETVTPEPLRELAESTKY